MLENLLTPPILFFLLGMAAVGVRSNLEIPQPIPKVLALYLLFAIGFRGGVELRHGGLEDHALRALVASVVLALVVPFAAYAVLRRRLDAANAAAVAATYGSISAVTFITAAAVLAREGIPFGGYMVAAMALMESPAIIIGVLLFRLAENGTGGGARAIDWPELLRDAFLNGSVFLLVGSLLIGAVTGPAGAEALAPLTDGLFRGLLTLFLLDMGLLAARRLGDMRAAGAFLVSFALVAPLVQAALGLALAWLLGLGRGDALLLTVLAASASYIAVPAAMRLAVPQANPSLYVPMSLAITFPFNVAIGIPLYLLVIQRLWS